MLTFFLAALLALWLERLNRAGVPGPFRLQVAGDNAQVIDTTTGQVYGAKPVTPSDDASALLDRLSRRNDPDQTIELAH